MHYIIYAITPSVNMGCLKNSENTRIVYQICKKIIPREGFMVLTKKRVLIVKRSISEAASVVTNDTVENAQRYAASGFENTYFLGYRELPLFLEKYSLGKRAVDYGCGTGRSTRFLQSNGFQVIGVDISKKMLQQAIRFDDASYYLHIKNAQIPVFDSSCDLVLSSFVLFMVPTKERLSAIFKEAYRCLRNEGVFIIVTGSEELYSHEWLSYETDYPQNANLKSGDSTKIKLRDLGIEFTNYYWTESDYNELIRSSGFKILEKHFPYGKLHESRKWISEIKHAPYIIYVLQKKQSPQF
jgi:SAM-dependent methyltransferase